MTDQDIAAACHQHGAKRLSDAAYAAMRGDHRALVALGISVTGIGSLHRITTVAYSLMDADEQVMDLAQASIDLAGLPRHE